MKLPIWAALLLFLFPTIHYSHDVIHWTGAADSAFKSGDYLSASRYCDSIFLFVPEPDNYYPNVKVNHALNGDQKAIEFLHFYARTNLESVKYIAPVAAYLKLKSSDDYSQAKRDVADQVNANPPNRFGAQFYLACLGVIRDGDPGASTEMLQKAYRDYLKNAVRLDTVNPSLNKYLVFCTSLLDETYTLHDLLEARINARTMSEIRLYVVLQKETIFRNLEATFKSKYAEVMDRREAEAMLTIQFLGCFPSAKNREWVDRVVPEIEINKEDWYHWLSKSWNYDEQMNSVVATGRSDSYTAEIEIVKVWGTWCGPCIRELPAFNSFYESSAEPLLVFQTLSYASEGLEEFMSEHSYSFPVREVEKEDVKLMKIDAYPTTLIFIHEKHFQMPAGSSVEEYARALIN